MIFVCPIHSGGDKKAFNLVSAVVKNSCAPFLVLALFHIAVFIKRLSVKFIKSVSVLWEMSRHPVKYNADSCLMAFVNKIHKVLGNTVARGGSKISRNLISP